MISANLSEHEGKKLLKTLKKHRASIAVPPNDPLEQYLVDHENDMFKNERRELDEVLCKQEPILKHNLPVEILGDPPPPKGDPVFELKPLPNTLKYAYLDEKKI